VVVKWGCDIEWGLSCWNRHFSGPETIICRLGIWICLGKGSSALKAVYFGWEIPAWDNCHRQYGNSTVGSQSACSAVICIVLVLSVLLFLRSLEH